MITRLSPRDISSGKLSTILGKLKDDLICEKPRLGVRNYTSNHIILVHYKGSEIAGILAWHPEKVQPPGKREPDEPEMDVIIIDTLCYKDDSTRKELMNNVPVIHYPTGRSPGIPSGYTTAYYNNEAEGDPRPLALPAAAPGVVALGGAATTYTYSNNSNNNNYSNNSNNNYNSKSRATNFAKKTEGRSAFFPKITVKTGGRRRRRQTRRRVMSRRQ